MSDALDHVRHNCGIAGEEVAEMVDALERQRDELQAEADFQRNAHSMAQQALLEQGQELATVTKERDELVKGCKVRVPTITMEQALATEYRRGYKAALAKLGADKEE